MHGVYHLLRTALCPMRPRSDLSFRTVIIIRPAVVLGWEMPNIFHRKSTHWSLLFLSRYTLRNPFTVSMLISISIKMKWPPHKQKWLGSVLTELINTSSLRLPFYLLSGKPRTCSIGSPDFLLPIWTSVMFLNNKHLFNKGNRNKTVTTTPNHIISLKMIDIGIACIYIFYSVSI